MFSELKIISTAFLIDVHQNATLSESFEGDRSRVIGNRCNYKKTVIYMSVFLLFRSKKNMKIS